MMWVAKSAVNHTFQAGYLHIRAILRTRYSLNGQLLFESRVINILIIIIMFYGDFLWKCAPNKPAYCVKPRIVIRSDEFNCKRFRLVFFCFTLRDNKVNHIWISLTFTSSNSPFFSEMTRDLSKVKPINNLPFCKNVMALKNKGMGCLEDLFLSKPKQLDALNWYPHSCVILQKGRN